MDSESATILACTVGFVAAGSLFWLQYFDLKDALAPEPRRRIAQAFGLGLVAAGVAWVAYGAAATMGAPRSPPHGSSALLVYCVLLVGVIEEGAKFLVARLVCFRWREFDEEIDGLVYAAAVALGFAAIENLLFLPLLSWGLGLLRALASPLTHSLYAAVWGFGTSHALLVTNGRAARFAWQAGSLAAAIALHGLYDFAVLSGAAPAAAAIAALLWVAVIWNARRVVRTPAAPS